MAKTTPSPATCPHYKRKKGRIKKKYRWFAHLAHRQKLSNKACLGREMVSRQGILTVKRRDKALSCFLSDADRWRTAVPFARTKAAHRLPTGRTPTNPHRGGGRRCGRGGRRDAHDQPQQPAQSRQLWPTTRGQKAIVPHLDKPPRQYMLQKAADELYCRKRHRPILACIGLAVGKSDPSPFAFENPAITDGDAKNVRCQIAQRRLSLAHRLAMDNPILPPHSGWNLVEERGVAQSVAHFGAKDDR